MNNHIGLIFFLFFKDKKEQKFSVGLMVRPEQILTHCFEMQRMASPAGDIHVACHDSRLLSKLKRY
ncbi:hypothetical protein [Acinetobacter venetianus]|uniref:hypothetical protein n=1 Tax=Acinetobacter venetianus TaxID=52133 RepID=UPI0007785A4A|nr:hypothetical protein [Acinetobacter venetianus]KXZ64979.1 hypothetical protein AVENLUH7437_01711 [Acinetobacter venetianus]